MTQVQALSLLTDSLAEASCDNLMNLSASYLMRVWALASKRPPSCSWVEDTR